MDTLFVAYMITALMVIGFGIFVIYLCYVIQRWLEGDE